MEYTRHRWAKYFWKASWKGDVYKRQVINGAAGNGAVGIQQAHEALGKNALAGAALAYDGKHLSLIHI